MAIGRPWITGRSLILMLPVGHRLARHIIRPIQEPSVVAGDVAAETRDAD
jgi:hypothetical protein